MMVISRPIVKHSFMVQIRRNPILCKKGFHLATTGRPGPVVIDIPKTCTDPEDNFLMNTRPFKCALISSR